MKARSSAAPMGRVAVIGGGISGLTTALKLAEAGVKVTVLEASGRVGGHIKTKEKATESGLSFEQGAELIASNQKGVIDLATSLGVGLRKPQKDANKAEMFHFGGKVYSPEQMTEFYKPLAVVFARYKSTLRDAEGNWTQAANQVDSMSLADLLTEAQKESGVNPMLIDVFKQAYRGQLGREPEEVSGLAFLQSIGTDTSQGFQLFGDDDEGFRVKGGTHSIIQALEAKLKTMPNVSIKTGQVVDAVTQVGAKVSVRTNGLEAEEYDHVISALPLDMMRNIQLDEKLGLSDEQRRAIRATTYSTLTKIGLETKGKPWQQLEAADGKQSDGTFISDGIFQCVWANSEGQETDTERGNGMVTFYVGGKAGTMPTEHLAEQAKAAYAKMLGRDASEIFTDAKPVFANWSTRGCIVAPGKSQFLPLYSFQEQKAPQFGVVGEFIPVDTSPENSQFGYMNNAVLAAEREVARTLQTLKERQQKVEQRMNVTHQPDGSVDIHIGR